ncbi:olfactory receptor 5B12-like [Hyperolius riggenbachi]|uniref:olfactory receptor 5B12-like n=1 Tax=Hyperolius riggenbachi TaxID=752182 RepID=UPI0035A3ABC8
MDLGNSTQVTMFELSELTDDDTISLFLFIVFLLVYLVTILGNVGLMIIVRVAPNLHTPMYLFLSYLALVDLLYSSSVTPKMLTDLISPKKTIAFYECATQVFFFVAFSAAEVPLMSSMSYDRYVAVCHPLHYVSIMTTSKSLLLANLSIFSEFLMSLAQTICVFSLQYCGSILINNFYCDVSRLIQLSCSETMHCNMLIVLLIGACGLFSLLIILTSYTLIFVTIIRIKTSGGRQKSFSTCSSHLMCVTILYVTVFCNFLHSPSGTVEKQDNVTSVFYAVVIPMLNPLIYSLKNQEVKRAMMRLYTTRHVQI